MSETLGIETLPPGAEEKLREFFGPNQNLGRVVELPLKRLVHDYCQKFIALEAGGAPTAFVIVSPVTHPGVVAESAERALAVQARLGKQLGANVLTPFFVGSSCGRSYSISAYCRPLSGRRIVGRLERWRLAPKALRWLEGVAAASMLFVGASELENRVLSPLRAIADDPQLEAPIRQAAVDASDDVRTGRWTPVTVAAHNDLWWGNFVHGRRAENPAFPYYVIDWGGGSADGVPIYDLVRLSMSLRLRPASARLWIERHRVVLRCRPIDTLGYLLVAFGALSQNRGEWPVDQFLHAIRSCFEYTTEALDMRERRSLRRSF